MLYVMAAKASSPISEVRCRSLNQLVPDLQVKLIVDNIKTHLGIPLDPACNKYLYLLFIYMPYECTCICVVCLIDTIMQIK